MRHSIVYFLIYSTPEFTRPHLALPDLFELINIAESVQVNTVFINKSMWMSHQQRPTVNLELYMCV